MYLAVCIDVGTYAAFMQRGTAGVDKCLQEFNVFFLKKWQGLFLLKLRLTKNSVADIFFQRKWNHWALLVYAPDRCLFLCSLFTHFVLLRFFINYSIVLTENQHIAFVPLRFSRFKLGFFLMF